MDEGSKEGTTIDLEDLESRALNSELVDSELAQDKEAQNIDMQDKDIQSKASRKKEKKLYRCLECTNSVELTVLAEVVCTRCGSAMRLFEAEQSSLFLIEGKTA